MNIKPRFALIILIIAFLFCTGSLVIKHFSFRTHAFDTGVQAQVARNAAFNLSYSSDILNMNYLADHFSAALIIPGALFYLWDNAATIMIFQNICVFLSIILAFILAKRLMHDNRFAILLAALYAANYYLHAANNSEYHIETLALPLFFTLFILVENRWTISGLIFIVLISAIILTIKEDLPLVLGAFGLWVLIFKKGKRPEGVIMAVIGLLGFYIIAEYLMPHFAGGILRHTERYGTIGATSGEMIRTAFTRPDKFVAVLFSPPTKILHIFYLFLSFLILPLAAPVAALTCLPPILIHSFSNYRPQYVFSSQYSLPAIPLLYYAAILGWQNMTGFIKRRQAQGSKIAADIIIKIAVVFIIVSAVFPILRYSLNYYRFDSKDYGFLNENIKPLIPKDCRLLSPNHVQPQFLDIKYSGILMGRYSLEANPDYIILTNDRIPTYWQQDDYLAFAKEQKDKCQIIYENEKLSILKTSEIRR